jgi:pilus assembly protein Flp/PilA
MLFDRKERGQGMVEYALIILLIAIVVVAALTIFGTQLYNTYSNIADNVAWLH